MSQPDPTRSAACVPKFSARVTVPQMEVALRKTIATLPREGHYGFAHSTGPFEYMPALCPECRVRVLEAILEKEALYA